MNNHVRKFNLIAPYFITNRVINWSYSDELVRIDVPVGVSYNSDLHFESVSDEMLNNLKELFNSQKNNNEVERNDNETERNNKKSNSEAAASEEDGE